MTFRVYVGEQIVGLQVLIIPLMLIASGGPEWELTGGNTKFAVNGSAISLGYDQCR